MSTASGSESQEPRPLAPSVCRGVRGATTVDQNSTDAILEATRELLAIIVQANDLDVGDLASVIFTTTRDLDAAYPARAARQLGWLDVALLCSHEIEVPGGLPRCIRVLLHWNTTRSPDEIIHVYLREAKKLRPDRGELPAILAEEMIAAVGHGDAGTEIDEGD